MRTLAPPAGRGCEYLTGTGWDFGEELAGLPELLAGKLTAPWVEAGRYDLVIDPSNLLLTIHESIGHATELDRALGYEAAYAGTSFATVDKLGTLQYGSPLMHVTGDRTVDARAGDHRLGRRGRARPVVGPDLRRRAGRLPAGPADRPAAGPAPVQRLRVRATRRAACRSSGWRTCPCSPRRTARAPRS